VKRRLVSRLQAGLALGLALIIHTASGQQAGQQRDSDYLTPELRERVEALKDDPTPTTNVNVRQRSQTIWEWANALARRGTELPVNLTQLLSRTLNFPAPGMHPYLDAYTSELALHDEEPNALGMLEADTGPFEARTFVTIRQRYTVGTRPIEPGGGFLIARHFMPPIGLWQITDPTADNYISIKSSNPDVSFNADSVLVPGMHGGFRGAAPTLVFRVAAGRLLPGDVVTITYGDTDEGGRGLLMAHFSSDRMPLPLYVAFKSGGHFNTLPIQPIRVTGTRVARVRGFAPSVVAIGEEFTLSVRAEDVYYNRATGDLPPWQVLYRNQHVKNIPRGGKAITLVHGVKVSEPGVHRFEIRSEDGSIVGYSNPILAESDPKRRIYWGDTHGHSGFAEGVGTPDRFMRWARDDARLDYVTHSEHDIWLDDAEWDVLRRNVQKFTAEGEFIAYLGYEWTVANTRGGHHNVLFRTPAGRNRIGAQYYPSLTSLYTGLRAEADKEDVVIIPHAHQAGDYRLSDPDLEPLIEIMSQHGNFEWFGRMYLNHGHQVGFTAASDNHLSQPGYSAPQGGSLSQRGGLGAVIAREKTTDALFDAMRNLQAYATSGDRIILDIDLNGASMGTRAPFAEERLITGRVVGTAPIDTITLVKNDSVVWQRDLLSREFDKLPKGGRFQLSFASQSEPFHAGDNPRGWRPWVGTIEVVNADLTGARPLDFASVRLQHLRRDTDNPRLLHFQTFSRGDASALELDLENVKRTTSIVIQLQEAKEFGGGPPVYRSHQKVMASEVTLDLRDLERGRMSSTLDTHNYTDTITLRAILDRGEQDVRFEFTDTSTRQGEYYYVRVLQANDAKAWSSPIWVGGHPTR
jgi:hypothetical protein